MHMISISVPFLAYVELYLGIYDFDRRCVRRTEREDGGSVESGAGLCGRSGFSVHYHDWRYGIMGRLDGNCQDVRSDRKVGERNPSFYFFYVSADSERACRRRVYFYEYYCEYTWAGLGVYAGRALSYYSDRLKNPLRNQGFPPNLVLMKKCSFASKHF